MEREKNELGEKKIAELLFSYALPAIIATTASSLYNIIDRIFIGHGVDALAISGLAITFPIMNFAVALGTLVGAGASALVSIRMGEKRRKDAINILGNAFSLNVIIGIIFSIISLTFLDKLLHLFGASASTLPYAKEFMTVILYGNVISHLFFGLNNIMRASGHPLKAMISVLLTVGINVMLAPLFIFIFKWGIKGAAFATVIAQCCGFIWVLAHFFNKKNYVHFTHSCFRLSKKIIIDIFAIGVSPFFIHIMASLVSLLLNWQLKYYGDCSTLHGGDYAIGAFGIISSVSSLIFMIILGLTQGMQPIVGYNFGAKRMSRVTQALKLTIYWGTATAFFGFLCAELIPHLIVNAFTSDKTMIKLTVDGLRLSMIAYPLAGFQIVTSYFFQSIGKAKIAIFLSLSRQLLFLIPFILILPHFFRLNGVWIAVSITDFVASITAASILLYFFKKNFFK